MATERANRRPLWPWIAAVVFGVPLLYMLSMPVFHWAFANEWFPDETLRYDALWVYCTPMRAIYQASPPSVQGWLDWYFAVLVR